MSKERMMIRKSHSEPTPERATSKPVPTVVRSPMGELQRRVGNRVARRLVARDGVRGAFKLDDETAARIERERAGGQPLDADVQERMGTALGMDLSGVRVHTSPEADALNRRLGARAFATGQDIFFRTGAYDPHTTAGQELIAHELAHVAQQSVDTGSESGTTVGAPDDAYEREANEVAHALVNASSGEVQRQEDDEEIRTQPEEEEEEEMLA